MAFSNIRLTREPLQPSETRFSASEGAVTDFYGIVRAVENSRSIDGIEYEAFESMARRQLELIASRAHEEFRLAAVTIHHRIGLVPAGEASLYVRVTARHRRAALDACGQIVERLKVSVPIWKHPVFSDVPTA
jgi:molybdopterin synthase catalytic subunit